MGNRVSAGSPRRIGISGEAKRELRKSDRPTPQKRGGGGEQRSPERGRLGRAATALAGYIFVDAGDRSVVD